MVGGFRMAARMRALWAGRGPPLAREDQRLLRRLFGALAGILLLAIVAAKLTNGAPAVLRQYFPQERILEALRLVESGGRENAPDGDNGAAIGPFQIHREYWQDALLAEPALGSNHSFADCRRREYAEAIVAAYMRKWVPAAWARGEAEVIARVHNGGPDGAKRTATLRYWQKVRARLEGS